MGGNPLSLNNRVYPHSVGPRADAILYSLDVPSEKLLIASFDGESATNFSVTFGSPSLTMRCTMISALKTIVHVESRSLCCSARKISATPASPAWVAMRMCSTYLALGGASCSNTGSGVFCYYVEQSPLTLIFVPPLTDFSKEPLIPCARRDIWSWLFLSLRSCVGGKYFLEAETLPALS